MVTTRSYGELDHELVSRAVHDIVDRYFETPSDDGDRIIKSLEDLTVAERVTVYSIFMRLHDVTRPPELENSPTGRIRDDYIPMQAMPGSPAAALERAEAGQPRRCPNCDSTKLSLDLSTRHAASAPLNGLLSGHDVIPMLVLGCDECSETIELIEDTTRIRLVP